MNPFPEIIEKYQDYLTFYHECRIPKHPFFDFEKNKNDKNFLFVSSPSRMGNHLLMSMLDGHPELPLVPGEDGFHMFSFTKANYDIHQWMQVIRGENVAEGMMDIASNGGGSKWEQFAQLYESSNVENVAYSGVGGHQHSAIVDFEGLTFKIEFEAYKKYLEDRKNKLNHATHYNEILSIYMEALRELTPKNELSQFDGCMVHGAMRTQLLWLCKTMPNVKILSSVRSFESYAISQIKSRHGDVKLTEEKLNNAWEHWFHKVVDMIYLRLHYPSQFGLVTFDDLVGKQGQTQKAVAHFLNISQDSTMDHATMMGLPVKGNSWKSRVDQKSGGFYQPQKILKSELAPEDARKIWDLVQLCKL